MVSEEWMGEQKGKKPHDKILKDIQETEVLNIVHKTFITTCCKNSPTVIKADSNHSYQNCMKDENHNNCRVPW